MLNDNQYKQKYSNVYKCVELFLATGGTQKDIAKLLDLSQSSVDRYLKDDEFIDTIYKDQAKSIKSQIKLRLEQNKLEGAKKGGLISQEVSPYLKNDNGHFIGSRKI